MQEVFALINEMSPFLLLGFLLAGLMHAFIPGMVYSRYLSGHGFRSVLYGALFFIPQNLLILSFFQKPSVLIPEPLGH